MIDHAHFRMMSMVDPYHRELSTRERDAFQAHDADCPACKQYHDRLLQFEERLELAFRVQSSHRAWRNGKPMLALAASLLLGLVIVSGTWIATTHSSLAADVVSHVAAESVTATSVSSEELHRALAAAGASLSPSAGLVSYASRCSFHGQPVPHLEDSALALRDAVPHVIEARGELSHLVGALHADFRPIIAMLDKRPAGAASSLKGRVMFAAIRTLPAKDTTRPARTSAARVAGRLANEAIAAVRERPSTAITRGPPMLSSAMTRA